MRFRCLVCDRYSSSRQETVAHLLREHRPPLLSFVRQRLGRATCPRCREQHRAERLAADTHCPCGYPVGEWALTWAAGEWAFLGSEDEDGTAVERPRPAQPAPLAATPAARRAGASELFRESIVIDGLDTSRWGDERVFRDLRDGGVTAVNATIAIWDGFRSTLDAITRWLGWFEQHRELIRPVLTVEDIAAAKREGRTGIIFGWQNATPIGNDLGRLKLFHQLGVRIIQLTYNERNLLGNGCYERADGGLSRFGVAAVREMNRLGILIDLSHVGDRTTLEAIERSTKPVAFTHANARAQHDHPRNKTNKAIRLLADRGGVVGANAFPMFFPNGFETTIEEYLDAIDYLVQMAGIDHVGIGADFCMGQSRQWFEWLFASQGTIPAAEVAPTPEPYAHLRGFASPAEFVNVAAGLLDRGYAAADVRKVLGGNWLRLFAEVWRPA